MLEKSQDDRSGVDWKTLFRVIVDRYSDRFELMNHLNPTSEGDALMESEEGACPPPCHAQFIHFQRYSASKWIL